MNAAKVCGLCAALAIAFVILSITIACRPSGPGEDFGEVVNEMPEIPGAQEPYVIPELGPSPSDVKKDAKDNASDETPPAKDANLKSKGNSRFGATPEG